jgi:hypothetical protein
LSVSGGFPILLSYKMNLPMTIATGRNITTILP